MYASCLRLAWAPDSCSVHSVLSGSWHDCTDLHVVWVVLALPLQAEDLTPAQQAARRKNKKGSPLDGLMMVMSLVKRW